MEEKAILHLHAAACCTLAAALLMQQELIRKRVKSENCEIQVKKKQRAATPEHDNIQYLMKEYKLSIDLDSYKSYLLMDEQCFEELLALVAHDISRADTNMRKSIPAAERLAVTLKFLATGESYKELGRNSHMSLSFLSQNVIDICQAIYENLKHNFLKFPATKEEWIKIAEQFESLYQFPNCLGAIDTKHVAMTPAKKDSKLYKNFKGFHSVLLLAMTDAQSRFIFVDVDNGRVSADEIFRRSALGEIAEDGETHFPEARVIGNKLLPYVIAADNSFPMMRHVMTPFAGESTNEEILNYNARIIRARWCVQHAFEIVTKRFQILQKKMHLDATKATKVILTCCVLHNFLMEKSPWYSSCVIESYEDAIEESIQQEISDIAVSKSIKNIRQNFVEHFADDEASN